MPRFCTILALAAGCKSDQGIQELKYEAIAVAMGDFDHVEEALIRMGVGHDPYEGLISQAVWDPELDPTHIALKTEALFTGVTDEGDPELLAFDAAFLNSGTRGFGEYVYNDATARDDAFVADPAALANIDEFLAAGRTVVISDWAGDLVEVAWPDRVTFVGEGSCELPPCLDAAQVGEIGPVTAQIEDEGLARALDADQLQLEFDFSYWTAMAGAAADVDVYLRGDITYRVSGAEGYGVLEDAPLLVGFDVGGGRVILSSFHWRAQNEAVTDLILQELLPGLSTGADDVTEEPSEDAR